MLKFWLVLGALLFTSTVSAAQECAGSDQIEQMSAEERSELASLVKKHPYPTGLLWQATRNDTTIWLFGTFHIYDAEAALMMGRITPLIERADAVYVEATRQDLERLQKDMLANPALLFNYDNPTLPDTLTEEEWQLLSTALKDRGMLPFIASKMAPWLVSMTISLPLCALQMEAAGLEGIDFNIMDTATLNAIPLRSLEPHDTLINLFSDEKFDDQIEMVRGALLNIENADDMFITMRNQYLKGQVREIWEISKINANASGRYSPEKVTEMFAKSEEILLSGRNKKWVEKLLAEVTGTQVFVAAGALHLSGQEGLLNLLVREGFEITALDSVRKN